MNVPSEGYPGAVLVVPGNPEASLLFRKLYGIQADNEGDPMPLGIQRNDAPVAGAELVELWILGGASTTCPTDGGTSSGGDGGLQDAGHHADAGAYDAGPGPVDVCDVASTFFANNCVECHHPGENTPDLTLPGVSMGLVNIPSTVNPAAVLIAPGNPTASLLYRKVHAIQGPDEGRHMPPFINAEDAPVAGAEILEEWILGGAPTQCDVIPDAGPPSDAGRPGDAAVTSDAGGYDAGPGPLDVCDVAATFFASNCVSCHRPGRVAPDLTVGGAPGSIVNVESVEFPGQTLVVPGDPSASLLYRKVFGVQAANEGDIMPLGTDPSEAPVAGADILEEWILGGAPTQCDVIPDAGIITEPDAGGPTDGGGGPGAYLDICDVYDSFFATSCVQCHRAGGTPPELTREAAATSLVNVESTIAPGKTLVVPGDLPGSLLYRKLYGLQEQGEGATMPLGVARSNAPVPGAEVVTQWIAEGARTTCGDDGVDGGVADAGRVQTWDPGPNALDQDSLFACTTPTTSSPARLRRVERREWTHSVGKPLTPTWYGSVARNNPFDAPSHLPYSTYSEGVTIDPATLDLYFSVLTEAGSGWTARTPSGNLGVRTYAVYNDSQLNCMFNDVAPTDACMDYYVLKYLRDGVLFRTPTDDERSRLKAFLAATIAEEGGDIAKRPVTMRKVTSAAWLTAGALFKSELGGALTDGRRRLTNDELARALGGVLSTFAPGTSAMWDFGGGPPAHPNWTAPPEGYLGQLRVAAADGTIQDPAVIEGLIDLYIGGMDPNRYDLQLDVDDDKRALRGEYWLASRVADFFREWLDYEGASIIFKDTPRATTQWDGQYNGDPMYDPITLGFKNLQNNFYGDESTLVQQLDDTIARVVLEDQQVFEKLLTTRMWRLPSNLAQTNGVACTADGDCVEPGYTRCTSLGFCGNSIAKSTLETIRTYNLSTNVPNTPEGRWVELPVEERAGVLTHPAWLAAHGGNFEDDASLVHRGKWIRENLLCEVVPPLELVQVEAKLVPSDPAKSARDRVHESIDLGPNAATCLGCHSLMNPLGYPFEIYNHAGFVRATDHGRPPDGSSTITNAPDPALNTSVTNAVDLSTRLAASPHAKRCFIRQTFRYFMGRNETPADACVLQEMENTLQESNGSFLSMLKTLVTSDAFLYRHDEGGAP
ncbi:MAG: DUF1588 domain-containing protein [Myxococcota bacterium]